MVTAPIHPRIFLLAARADSHAASLSTTLNALVELEKFVSIEHATDDEDMAQLRISMSRLMRALHEDMQRRIGLVADATAELRAVVEGSRLA
jgi:CHAD domain-containing protein